MAENMEGQAFTDPWAEAFAALGKEEEEDTQAAAATDAGQPMQDTPEDGGADSAEAAPGDGGDAAPPVGGPGDLGGEDGGEDEPVDEGSIFYFDEGEAEQYKKELTESIEQQTLRDVAAAYIKQGARHQDGKLGATINDEDICKRDRDGVPRFYNPDTGREFSGDNPRRQAQEWVDDYNKELADAFNKTCSEYSKKLMDEQGAGLAVIEFAPKYAKLDPVRRAMFESIIEDYEIRDKDGDLVGYSCDLDKALNAVNRQVKVMQEKFADKAKHPKEPSGPALDMKSSAGASEGGVPEFKSIAEAMEWQQDQLLRKTREGR